MSYCNLNRSKYRIKESHPAHKAILKLFDYLEEHHIQIAPARYVDETFDVYYKGHRYALHDLEQGPVLELPPGLEYVIGTDELPKKK
jgi:hypothetical protein